MRNRIQKHTHVSTYEGPAKTKISFLVNEKTRLSNHRHPLSLEPLVATIPLKMAFYKGKNKKTDPEQAELFTSAEVFGIKAEVQAFIDEWNSKIWLPRIIGTPRQIAMVRDAMDRPFFREHWRETIPLLTRSTWLRTKMRPAFSIDFYLEQDNFDKILEGKYITEKAPDESIGSHKVVRDGDDEKIL